MPENAGLYKILRIKKVNEPVKGFKLFILEGREPVPYKAGQYLTLVNRTLTNPDQPAEAQEIRRSYSITSVPELNEPLSIGIKRIPNGFFSRLLVDHAEPGDELITTGAGGLFILPDDVSSYKQIFFFAAGSGITPVYALLKAALHLHPHLQVILIYSNRTPGTTIFLEELKELQKQFPRRFKIEWLFSNTADLSKARLYRESLMQIVINNLLADHADTLYYICGPLSYMRMCTFVLQEMQVSPAQIKRENFLIAQAPPPLPLPPDTRTHRATIHFGSDTFKIPVHYPDSILKAAKKQGIQLPYSCETGRCANCLAHCMKGQVWLSHNEVLTEKEVSNGLTLTCVGHPVGGDVELEIKKS